MRKSNSNQVLDSLFVTPLVLNNDMHAQDMLGWMGEVRTLQHETFPQFTVLTNYRWHAETLLFLVGLAENFVEEKNKRRYSVNHFFRDFELFWALSQLTQKNGSIDGFLNIQRFKLYWEQHKNSDQSCQFCISLDDGANYLQNLGYGVAPHYWTSLLKWGLIDKERREFPRLTERGRQLFEFLKPFSRSSNQKEVLNKWFSGKSLTKKEIAANAEKYFPQTETALYWYSLAEQKAKNERAYGVLWHILSFYSLPDNIEKFRKLLKDFEHAEYFSEKRSGKKFSDGDILRRWVIQQLPVSDVPIKDQIVLNDLFKRCREAEVLGGISNFLMSAMVLFTEQNKDSSIEIMARKWISWLPNLKKTFLNFYSTTSTNSTFRKAFPKLKENCSSEIFLRSILERHIQVKGTQALLREENCHLVRTEATPPKLNPQPLLEKFRLSNFDLPTEELSHNPDDPWREFTELDFHWNRFADWMRISNSCR